MSYEYFKKQLELTMRRLDKVAEEEIALDRKCIRLLEKKHRLELELQNYKRYNVESFIKASVPSEHFFGTFEKYVLNWNILLDEDINDLNSTNICKQMLRNGMEHEFAIYAKSLMERKCLPNFISFRVPDVELRDGLLYLIP